MQLRHVFFIQHTNFDLFHGSCEHDGLRTICWQCSWALSQGSKWKRKRQNCRQVMWAVVLSSTRAAFCAARPKAPRPKKWHACSLRMYASERQAAGSVADASFGMASDMRDHTCIRNACLLVRVHRVPASRAHQAAAHKQAYLCRSLGQTQTSTRS